MNFSNGLALRSATFRESVRLPGSSQTAFYITSDDYPLTYYPDLHLLRCTLPKGRVGIQGQSATRCYHVSVMKDCDPVDDPAEATATSNSGLLVVASASNIRQNPVTGVFERVTDEPAPVVFEKGEMVPSVEPKRRGRKPKGTVTVAAVDMKAGTVTTTER